MELRNLISNELSLDAVMDKFATNMQITKNPACQ